MTKEDVKDLRAKIFQGLCNNKTKMKTELYLIKNKIPKLSYAFTLNGVELPVLDTTHPLFISSINEVKLKEMLRKSEKTADKTADKFNNMPIYLKKFLAKHSFIMSELLQENGDNAFLTGLSTLMLKLGPSLIGKGKKRFLDRLSSKGIGGIVLRMRVRDISKCLANKMIPLLTKSPEKDICLINIAGGAASDSFNTLFLIQQENPELLRNRKIEINVLDIDTYGPAFADRCLAALKAPGNRFYDLNISFRHIHYDWNNTGVLAELLSERKEWLQICSSEGGLFEYCSDEVITQNLNTIFNSSNEDIIVTGSLLHDIKTVDAGIIAALKISTSIKPRFLGIEGLKNIIENNKWKLDSVTEGNPRYLIFALRKSKNDLLDAIQLKEIEKNTPGTTELFEAYTELERGVYSALETYSNVHRGSGHNSMVSTHLFEQARDIILEYLDLKKEIYVVIFCTPRRAASLMKQLEPESYQIVTSLEIGLSLGVRALAVKRKSLPGGTPFQTGGGTTKLISKGWVIWADAPDKFEAGTPAIVNIIAFAKALRLIQRFGKEIFRDSSAEKLTTTEILYRDELEKYSAHELLDELRKTQIGRSVRVPTVEGATPFINFDNSASTPTFTPIWNAFRSSWHQSEQVKQEIIQEVKSICAKVLGAPLAIYDVIFTSNTTEAINLTAESLSIESVEGNEPVVLNTLLEHSSNDLPWRMVPGYSLIRLSVDAEGFVDLNELETLLSSYNQKGMYGKKLIRIVAVSGASNVLGVCNNIKEISRIVHLHGARLLVDAAQMIAHRKISMDEYGIDYLAFSAHKVYAPFGCGVLVVRKGLLGFNIEEMELIQSSGEENAGGIAALGKALVLLQRIGMELIQKEEQVLTARTLRGLAKIPDLRIYGIKDSESPGFSNKIGVIVFDMKNKMPSRVAKQLALQSGIGVRYGCHCAHIIIKRLLNISPFLESFQRLIQTLFPKFRFLGLVRVSLGIENNEEDVDKLIQALGKIAGKPLDLAERNSAFKHVGTHQQQQKAVQQQMNDFVRASALKVYS